MHLILAILLCLLPAPMLPRAQCDVAEINQHGRVGATQLILWRGVVVTDWCHLKSGLPAMVPLPEGGWLIGVEVEGQPAIVHVQRVVVSETAEDPEQENKRIVRSEHRPHLFLERVMEWSR